MPDAIALGIPPVILNLVQTGLLERAFHDGLFPALMYRAEAAAEEWEGNTGTEIFMTRPGLLAPITTPIAPGVDPIPQTLNWEQWRAALARYGGTIDTHMPTSATTNANLFMRNIQQLGLQAGQSLNRIPRNELFKAYLSGQTVLTTAAVAGDTTLRVASLNGFVDVIVVGTNARPTPVSASTPLAVTIAGVTGTRNVIGATPDDPNDPTGPGTLTLSAAVGGAGAALRAAVLSSQKPLVIRSGGGTSVDAISASDVLTLQDLINAVNKLRKANVPPHEDGFYHGHLDTDGNSQIFTDPAFQRLNTSMPDGIYYQKAFVGTIAGIAFFLNTEAPDLNNSGPRTLTGTANPFYSKDISAETTNDAGVNIGRVLITGRGALYERWLDEKKHYVSEAGITGKQGDFTINNAGIEVKTDRIRLILRAPINRFQDMVAATWSITTSFPIPSDVTAGGGSERFRRAVIIEHAID